MFLKMPLYFFLWLLLILGKGTMVQACAIGDHHSTTYHYNNAQKVFVGVLLSKQATQNADTSLLTFKIKKAYKNCKAGEVIQLKGNAYTTALVARKSSHLVYAQATLSTALYCPQLQALKAPKTSRQLAVLKEIILHPKGTPFIEYSPYGQVWAKGHYQEGAPYHVWTYYAYSGEVQLTAQYVRGLRSSQWRTYSHLKDSEYKILHEIMTGLYARKWDDYAVVGVDTNEQTEFRYTLRYLVDQDTIEEQFYYNQPYLTKTASYREGHQDGLEQFFDQEKKAYRTYTFKDGRLHGLYREVLDWGAQEGGVIEVKGQYTLDKREEEIHYYYNAQGHLQYKKVLIENGKTLASERIE